MDFLKRSSKWTLVYFGMLLLGGIAYVSFAYFRLERQSVTDVEIKHRPNVTTDSVTEFSVTSNQLTVTKSPTPTETLETFNRSLMTILLWTWPLGYQFPLNRCPRNENSGCFYTVNRNAYSIADAVVVSHRDVYKSEKLLPPEPRPSDQYWIWFSMESPTNCPNLNLMDNKINLTMSYRLDSDIYVPSGGLEKVDGKINFTIPQKSKLVAWVVSNWKTKYRRTQYCEELKKYIPIDIYGKNGLPLPRNETLQTLATYKFYLAFENSVHEDYITEKFWKNSLMVGTVPIVMGPPRKNYERFIPPDAFIHVDDFSSPQLLAEYLLGLDKDEKRYQKYFNWRFRYRPTLSKTGFLSAYCKICGALKEAPLYRTIPSIAEWFK
ncbi:3-galactosyl-N-acetylglucosaminide 4-alpha-L-fucosyltransferase FUT3-like [Rana temporaria]|uniref:3-galactosyl-N-acetylglucosaminide 4-alpha-L-fucosyltransferase FUT3-like n=1 Tax=Rana temporaria TaxID=8407 RepID=UPI001AADFF20|nr:3-galactosyl-N-acetylglucosaminide 4-alpha-L-fucosyltransferase FUT3-like [Rana temporaria]